MNRDGPDWTLYRTLLAVITDGSLSGAARNLGLTQPTVARHIDALEAALGLDLFIRSQRGLAPTDAALSLQPYAALMASTSAALLRAASGHGDEVRGAVRISASEVVGVEVLPPMLASLRQAHPALVIELTVSNALDDLLQREADIAVRMVEPTQTALIARSVGAVPLGLHAHRQYLDRKGVPSSLDDLAHHDLIGFDNETPALRAMLAGVIGISRDRFALRADSDLAQLAAIRAGFGIGVCQLPLAKRHPDLVQVIPDAFSLKLGAWIVMHEDLRSSPRCRPVFDALLAGLTRYVQDG